MVSFWIFASILLASVHAQGCSSTSTSTQRQFSCGGSAIDIASGVALCYHSDVVSPIAFTTSGTASYSNFQGDTCPGGLGGCDTYRLSFGYVPAGNLRLDCNGFNNEFLPNTCTAASPCGLSAGFPTIPAGQKPTIRIQCLNSVADCTFLPASMLSVVQNTQQMTTTAPTTTAPSTTPTGAPSSTTTPSSGGIWAGSYSVNPGCSTDQCCCLTDPVTVTQSGTSVTINTGLVGQCQGANQGVIPVTISSSTATTATFSYGGQDFQATKNGNSVTIDNLSNSACSGTATCTSGGCLTSSGGGASSAPCFHTDTVITYAGKDHTFDEIRAHPECSIPHVVRAHGVTVTAQCGAAKKTLRLTDGHLVYTQRGLQPARELKAGEDTLFADLAESTKCIVVCVTKEPKQHDYFGLNCLKSRVLAGGLKSSTFEKLHSVPAFWMQVMGRVLGIKRASQLGDYIAEIVQKMNLI